MALLDISLDWPAKKKDTGEIYFIQIENIGAIKIGWAKNTTNRFYSLQSGCPYPLRILYIADGHSKQDEKSLHDYFRKYHMRGEWFHPDQSIFKYITRCKKHDEHLERKRMEKMESRSYAHIQTGDWIDNADETLGEHLERVYG